MFWGISLSADQQKHSDIIKTLSLNSDEIIFGVNFLVFGENDNRM